MIPNLKQGWSTGLPQKEMRRLAQRGCAMNSKRGQGNRTIPWAGAYESLILIASDLNKTIGGLNNTETIDLVHFAAILGTAVPRTGNDLMCLRHKAGTATGIP